MQRRKASRYRASVRVSLAGATRQGPAEIENLSSIGALVVGFEWTPTPASLLTLTLDAAPDLSLTGRVVRYVRAGVAVEFEGLGPAERALLEDLARI